MSEIILERGTVKWFNPKKGFGFILRANGERDIFVHHTDIAMEGFRQLEEGQAVEFEIEQTDRGAKAVNVQPL